MKNSYSRNLDRIVLFRWRNASECSAFYGTIWWAFWVGNHVFDTICVNVCCVRVQTRSSGFTLFVIWVFFQRSWKTSHFSQASKCFTLWGGEIFFITFRDCQNCVLRTNYFHMSSLEIVWRSALQPSLVHDSKVTFIVLFVRHMCAVLFGIFFVIFYHCCETSGGKEKKPRQSDRSCMRVRMVAELWFFQTY